MGTGTTLRIAPSERILAATRQWLAPVRAALGPEFLAAYLTGSVLTQGFDPRRSRVDVLVIARNLDVDTLDRLRRALPRRRSGPRFEPRFFTGRQVEHSLDAFPVQWIEVCERHLLMEGHDILGPLEVPQTFLRLQCERELRGRLTELRHAYLELAGRPTRLGPVLKGVASGYSTLFRTLLRLRGETPPGDIPRVIERVADTYDLHAEGLLGAYLVRYGGRTYRGAELMAIYRNFLTEVERLVTTIDRLRVAGGESRR